MTLRRMRDKPSFGRKLPFRVVGMALCAGPFVLCLVNAPHVRGQSAETTGASVPSFEVAAIKPNRSADFRTSIRFTAGRFTATGMTTKLLIKYAYELRDDQISGGPSWIDSERYDIDAKEEDSVIETQRKLSQDQSSKLNRLAIQSLLADRFKLKVSHETKELPIYALVVAKSGSKLTPTAVTLPDPADAGANGPPRGAMMRMGGGELTATAVRIADFADVLSQQPDIGGRVVLDRTGLTGRYDLHLKWTPDQNQFQGRQGPDNAPQPDAPGPSIFTAIQEQLGLRLESTKGPVETVVIDHIEEPSAN